MCLPGLAVVVSPLISLMKDQVDALRQCGVPAAFANSTLSAEERRQVAGEVRAKRLRLLYLAPERLLTESTLEFLRGPRSRSWPSTKRTASARGDMISGRIPGAGHAAGSVSTRRHPRLHGDGSERVRRDIAEQLRLKDPQFLIGSFDRPNLVYKVQRRSDRLQQIRQVLDRHPHEAGSSTASRARTWIKRVRP